MTAGPASAATTPASGPARDAFPIALLLDVADSAATVGTALGAIAAQTVKPSELIVLAGPGDRAGAPAAVQGWETRLPIRVVRDAVDPATGATAPWLARVHAADTWLPDHLATLARAIDGDDAIVTPQELDWDPARGIALETPRALPVPPRAEQFAAILRDNFVSRHALFPRALYERAGGIRPELGDGRDRDLWIRMLRLGAHVVVADHATVLRRVGDTVDSPPEPATDCDVEVMRRAIAEAADRSQRALAEAGLRRVQARLDLARALEHARRGQRRSARRAAVDALRSGARAEPSAWLTALAPDLSIRLEDRIRRRSGPDGRAGWA